MTLAGITIDKQEMALVDEAYWFGDGVVSGIIGFAYSSLTSAFPGTNPATDSVSSNIHYTNWIGNAIAQKKIDPLFSVAIERGANGGGGQVALGGLPTIPFDHSFASAPLEIKELTPHPIEKTKLSYYTITPNGYNLDGKPEKTDFPVVIDTGTTLVYLPPALAKTINEAFDPPSVFVAAENGVAFDLWENDCNATPPKFAITIGGQDFYISPDELLLTGESGYDNVTGLCVSLHEHRKTGQVLLYHSR